MAIYIREMANYIHPKRNYIDRKAVYRRRIANDSGPKPACDSPKASDNGRGADNRDTDADYLPTRRNFGDPNGPRTGADAAYFHRKRICSGENLERGGKKAGGLRGNGSGGSTPRRFGPALGRW